MKIFKKKQKKIKIQSKLEKMSSVNFELNDHAIGSIMTFTTRMLNSKFPIDVNKDEETCEHVTVNGQSGCWLNKKEVNEWKGKLNKFYNQI